jgi:hypothetical protein
MMSVTKEAEMGKKAWKSVAAPSEGLVGSESAELPERWSIQRKVVGANPREEAAMVAGPRNHKTRFTARGRDRERFSRG